MATTTPNIGLKKWESGDTVQSKFNADNTNADKLDQEIALLTATFTSDYFTNITVRKIGRLVILNGNAIFTKQVPAATATIIGTLPEGFRPAVAISLFRPQMNSTERTSRIRILTNGKIELYHYGSAAMPVDGQLDLNTVFIAPQDS